MSLKTTFKMVSLLFISTFFVALNARADVEQMKAYKAAFPGEKAKCSTCHMDAVPKKDKHDLNDYGKQAKAALDKPTVEVYKKLGIAPEQKPAQK